MSDKELYQLIVQQTRNGRQEIYLPIEIIKRFDPNFNSTEERAFINYDKVRSFVNEYERTHFKEILRYRGTGTKFVKTDNSEISFIEFENGKEER